MKQRLLKNLALIGTGIVFAVGLSYVVYAVNTTVMPNGNVFFPVNVTPVAQVKDGDLAVGSLHIVKSAEVDKILYLTGTVHGGQPTDTSSTVYLGKPGDTPLIDTYISGSTSVLGKLTVGSFTGSGVCSDSSGTLTQCAALVQPTVSLLATPSFGSSSFATTLKVNANNFTTIDSCKINQNVGAVSMSQSGTTWNGSVTQSITQSHTYTVTCMGVSGGSPATATASAYVNIGSTAGYYAHGKELCSGGGTGAYPACSISGATCVGPTGQPVSVGVNGSCSLRCIVAQAPIGGTCPHGGTLTCSAASNQVCI